MARKGKELIISLETNQDITLEITRFSKKAETFSEFTGITPVLKQKRAMQGRIEDGHKYICQTGEFYKPLIALVRI